MEAQQSQSAPRQAQQHTEVRVAVAFNGGVALAVYESGVAVELFELSRGYSPAYQKLRSHTGEIVVDVISGASAGGLNGAVLANTLINGGNIKRLIPLWMDLGDFGELLQPWWQCRPKSILNGDFFLEQLKSALATSQRAASEQEYLDLFITATSLDGLVVPVETWDGRFNTLSFRQIVQFRYRKDGPNDFDGDKACDNLACAARASASFPIAFAPVRLDPGKFNPGQMVFAAGGPADYIDGGVLDNRPIELVLDAIARRHARRRVKRHLFYVEPDPEDLSRRIGAPAREYGPAQVAIRAIHTLPNYQSITNALRDIAGHNQRVAERRKTLDFFDQALGQLRMRGNRNSIHAAPGGPSVAEIRRDNLKETPDYNPGTSAGQYAGWLRYLDNAYLDLRLGRDLSAEVAAHLRTLDLWSRAPERTREVRELCANLAYKSRRLIADCLDMKFQGRLYHYLTTLVREVYDGQPPQVVHILNELKAKLYSIEEKIAAEKAEQQTAENNQLAEIGLELSKLVADRVGEPDRVAQRFQTFVDELSNGANLGHFAQRRWNLLESHRKEAFVEIKAAFIEALAIAGSKHRPLIDAYWKIRDALDGFFLRDILLFPLTLDSEFALELEQICFSRISPVDATVMGGGDAHDKLAGEVLAHFGGFLKREWRGNDLAWGRLDAAEILIRKIAAGQLSDPEINDLVIARQKEILQEMAANHPPLKIEQPNGELIGRESLADVPAADKFGWSGRVMFMLVKMFSSEQRAPFGFLLNLLQTPMLIASFLLSGLGWLYRKFRKTSIVLLTLALAMVLWRHSLHDLWVLGSGFIHRMAVRVRQ
jgi:patatin-related protein